MTRYRDFWLFANPLNFAIVDIEPVFENFDGTGAPRNNPTG
jgi:hypothetical protein